MRPSDRVLWFACIALAALWPPPPAYGQEKGRQRGRESLIRLRPSIAPAISKTLIPTIRSTRDAQR